MCKKSNLYVLFYLTYYLVDNVDKVNFFLLDFEVGKEFSHYKVYANLPRILYKVNLLL